MVCFASILTCDFFLSLSTLFILTDCFYHIHHCCVEIAFITWTIASTDKKKWNHIYFHTMVWKEIANDKKNLEYTYKCKKNIKEKKYYIEKWAGLMRFIEGKTLTLSHSKVCVCVCEYGGNNNKKEEEEKKYCAQWCLVCIQQLFNVTILWKLKRRINHKYCIVLTGAVLTTRWTKQNQKANKQLFKRTQWIYISSAR